MTEWKAFIKDKKDGEINSDVFLAFFADSAFTSLPQILAADVPSAMATIRRTVAPVPKLFGSEETVLGSADEALLHLSWSRTSQRKMPEEKEKLSAGKTCTKQASPATRRNGTDFTEERVLPSKSQNEKTEDGTEQGASFVGIHLSSTQCKTTIRLSVVRAKEHGEKGKKKLVNCLLDSGSERSLIRTDVADELKLQSPTSDMTVKGVNGLKVRIPDLRRVRFRLIPAQSESLEPLKEGIELTALSLPSLCDDLVGFGPTWAQFCSHSVPLFIYWSLSSLFYYWSLTSLSY
ncbi:hypothetical protein T03_234 [Trichinella britovi]|uniref:Peptidase A2 domain-containing protein n=1 Tax=Trichinella britovi TaxID=45882 RepID=A0A0V1CA61_TRIBR|nr:hypothetical protein T03_234 [Trichinella britovi]